MSVALYFLPLLIQIVICSGALLPVTKCKLSDSQCLKTSAQAVVPLITPGIPEVGAAPLDLMHNDVINVILAGLNLVILDSLLPVTKCKLSDSQCLKTSAQAVVPLITPGIPEVGAAPLDLMHNDVINVILAGLNLVIKDATIKGLKKARIDQLSVDMDKKQIKYTFSVDVVLKGKYKASGQLLILPISGDGDVVIKGKNVQLNVTYPFEVVKNAEGKDAIKLKSYSFTFDVRDGAHFDLTNLFNGNKALSDPMLVFMNENWKVLSEEFGLPIFDAANKVIYQTVKKYLLATPLEDIVEL